MTTATRLSQTRHHRVLATAPDGTDHVLDLAIDGDATVADVVAALEQHTGQIWPPRLIVAGQTFDPGMALIDLPLQDGALLAATPPVRRPHAVAQLTAVSGAGAGETLRYAPGCFSFGEPPGGLEFDDMGGVRFLPRPGCEVLINGRIPEGNTDLRHGDVLVAGRTAYVLGPVDARTPSGVGSAFNRPPRPAPPADPPPLSPPSRQQPQGTSVAFRWTMLAAPILLGLVMMAIFRRPAFLLFILMSPLMMVATYVDGRLRNRKGSRRAEAAFQKAVREFRHRLDEWRAAHHAAARRRQATMPELVARALHCDERLWERRRHHPDFLWLYLGYGSESLTRPVGDAPVEAEIAAILATPDARGSFPMEVDMSPGAVVGLVGPPEVNRALARALVIQAATQHGPADLDIAIVCEPNAASAWTFASWLPHTATEHARRMTAAGVERLGEVMADVAASRRSTLLVIDGAYSPERAAALNQLADEHDVAVLVLAEYRRQLPGMTSLTVEVRPGNRLTITRTSTGQTVDGVTPVLVESSVACDAARALAGVDDPEKTPTGASTPDRIGLLEVLGMPDPNPGDIARRWADHPSTVSAPIGVTATGVMEIDLVNDGPHALLAGTTGAGKSELLRTLVAGLAAQVDPEHLNFVLIDYKGGSAFDVCAELPHVVGLVTDLDPALATRAVVCLEAELQYREHRLRDAGASDLPAYLLQANNPPLPRLFIVIDEFAAMAKELPDFMTALVDIAARGRSLGVHLMLATQRPAGVIGENIRANTNLRLALRVQSVSDSKDVLGDDAAACLPRSIPGRAYARFGPSELVEFQTALVSGSTGYTRPAVHVQPARFDPDGIAPVAVAVPDGVQTDLQRLVSAISAAAVAGDHQPGHTPWPPALTPDLALHTLLPAEPLVIGVADEPARQRHVPLRWDPTVSALALYGLPGSGPEAAAETVIRAVAASYTQAEAEIYVMKFGTHAFTAIESLPHVASPIEADDHERQVQLLRMLQRTFADRRADPAVAKRMPKMFVVIDDAGGFRDQYDSYHLTPHLETVGTLIAKGGPLGMHVVATMSRPNALPMKLASQFLDRYVFQFPDMSHAMALGVPRTAIVEHLPHGGLIDARTGLVAQIAIDHDGVPVKSDPTTDRPAVPVLPDAVSAADLPGPRFSASDLWLPLGVGQATMGHVGIELSGGDHLVITSPMRGGKSSVMANLARTISDHVPHLQLVAIHPRRSPLAGLDCFKYHIDDPSQVAALVSALAATGDERIIVFVDDASMIQSPALDQLLATQQPNVHFVAALRNEEAIRSHTHWTRRLRDCQKAVAIQPSPGVLEGYGHPLPKRTTPLPPGRGYLIDGHRVVEAQIAC